MLVSRLLLPCTGSSAARETGFLLLCFVDGGIEKRLGMRAHALMGHIIRLKYTKLVH